MGIAAALVVSLGALQYGEVLRWQVRAQNAADAAAAAALSVQAAHWNQQVAAVYAASLEEYRLRNLLEGMIVASNNDPTCQPNCASIYGNLYNSYTATLARYRTDIQLVNRVSQYTQSQAEADATSMVNGLASSCGQAGGGDCAFSYSVTAVEPRQGNLNQVLDGASAWAVNYGTEVAAPQADYVPLQIEVVTCTKVKPMVPAFLNFSPPVFTAIGRAAATTAMVTEEWLQPGHIVNPATGKVFQPVEDYRAGYPDSTDPNGHDWYQVSFDGNPAVANPAGDWYQTTFAGPHFEVATGWWSTIPIKPFTGPLNTSSLACSST